MSDILFKLMAVSGKVPISGNNPPTAISLNPTSSTSLSPTYSVTATASGGTADARFIRLGTSGGYSNNGAAFTVSRGTTATFQAYNSLNSVAGTIYSQSFSIPYLGSEYADSSLTASSQTVASTVGSGTISFTDGNVSNYYQLVRNTSNSWPLATSTISTADNTTPYQATAATGGMTNPSFTGLSEGNGLWPAAGDTYYYRLRIRLRGDYGGQGTQADNIWASPTISVARASAPATDVTPNALNWGNILTGNSSANTNSQTVTGINTAITLRVDFDEDRDNYTLQANVNGTLVGNAVSSPGNFSFSVSNNDVVYFRAVGGETRDSTADVTNTSDGGATIDSFAVTLED